MIFVTLCHGNGYTSESQHTITPQLDFRDDSQVHQCWDCDSQEEFYEYVSEDNIVEVPNDEHSIH